MLIFVFSFSINAKEMVIQTTTSYILEKFTYSNESTYSITLSGDKLTTKFKNDLDILIEQEIKNES